MKSWVKCPRKNGPFDVDMTLPGIGAFLGEHKLRFLGFEHAPSMLHAYRRRFPADPAATDLRNWEVFENENPDTFVGMHQFWVQKADSL